jgi:hypothetical protein
MNEAPAVIGLAGRNQDGLAALEEALVVCHFHTPELRQMVINQGYHDIISFAESTSDDIRDMVKKANSYELTMARLRVPRRVVGGAVQPQPAQVLQQAGTRGAAVRRAGGGIQGEQVNAPMVPDIQDVTINAINARQEKRLRALAWWVRYRSRQGLSVIEPPFDDLACMNAIAVQEADDTVKDTVTAIPAKFSNPANWTTWNIELENYLAGIMGKAGIPIDYVIRRDEEPREDSPYMRAKYNANLYGPTFNDDNRTVFRIIKSLTLNTPAWEFLKEYDDSQQNGRLYMQILRRHYEGESFKEANLIKAKEDIANAYYNNERTFTFEKFVTKLTGAFAILAYYDEPYTERQKVRELLSKLSTCPNDLIRIAAVNLKMTRAYD